MYTVVKYMKKVRLYMYYILIKYQSNKSEILDLSVGKVKKEKLFPIFRCDFLNINYQKA
jgi:hypothetical protein